MIAVLQRVNEASVTVLGKITGKIGKGLYILLGVERGDTEADACALAEKISRLRIFEDENEKMNLSVNDVCGEVLVVPNFTLNANYSHGNRPDYLNSASPAEAEELFEFFKCRMKELVKGVESGVFGADMTSEIVTSGPVTIVMKSDVLLGKDKKK